LLIHETFQGAAIMISKPLVAAFLAAGCVGAAAAGAYVAVRQDAPGTAATPVVQAADSTPAATPVAETEAIVTPAPSAAPAPAAPAPDTNVERPSTPPARPVVRPAPETRKPRAADRTDARDRAAPSAPSSERASAPIESPAPVSTARPEATIPPAPPIPEPPPAPPEPQFVQVVVPASSVIGLHLESSLSSERARVEDRVDARVTRDVSVAGRVAIPAGSRVVGSVVSVERGGKIKERARLGVRFHTLVFADGTEVPIRTDAIYREGDSPGSESAKKIGVGAAGGAILGAILGGGKGAAIGGAAGAAGGTAVVMAGDRNAATLPAGTIVTVRLTDPVTVDVEKRDRDR
jgi:hypothetical protein